MTEQTPPEPPAPPQPKLVRTGFFRVPKVGSPEHKRRSRFKWFMGCLQAILSVNLLAVLLAVMAFVAWLHSADFQRRSTTLVETVLEDQLGEQATLSRVNVRFWPPGVDVDGLHIFGSSSEGEIETIVSAERVRVPLVLRGGGIKIGRLAIQRPVINLHLEKQEDGKLKLREFQNRKRPEKPKPLLELPFRQLRVKRGIVRLHYPDGKVEVTGLDANPVDGPTTDISANIHVQYKDFDETTHLELIHTELGPNVIEVPDIALRMRSLFLSGAVKVPLGGEIDANLTASVDLDDFNDLLVEPRQAHGLVDLDVHVGGKGPDIQVEASAYARHFGLDLPGKFTPLLTYEIGDLSAAVVARKDELIIERAVLNKGKHGTLRVWGSIDLVNKHLNGGHIVGDQISLEQLLKSFDAAPTPWIEMVSDLEITLDGPLDPPYLQGDFELSVKDLQVGDRPISDPDVQLNLDLPTAYAEGSILIEKTRVYLAAPVVKGPKTRGELTCSIGTVGRGPLDLNANLFAVDLSDFQPLNNTRLKGTGQLSGRIWGPFNRMQFLGKADVNNFSVVGIPWADRLVVPELASPRLKSLEFREAQAFKGESVYHGDYALHFTSPAHMDTDLTLSSGRIQDIIGMFIKLPGLTGEMVGDLSLHGPLNDLDGGANFAFRDIDMWGEHFEVGEAHGYMDEGLFTLDALDVTRNNATEGLVMRGTVKREWALDMELIGDGFQIETLDWLADAELPVTGKALFNAQIGNTLFEPEPHGRIVVSELRYDGFDVEDTRVVFTTDEGVMRYAGVLAGGDITLDGTLGLWGEQPYEFVADLEEFPAHLFYPQGANGHDIEAHVSGAVAAHGDFGEVWSPVTLRTELDTVTVDWRKHHLSNKEPWHYAQDGNSWNVEGISLHDPKGATDFSLVHGKSDEHGMDVQGGGVVDMNLLRMVVPGLEKSQGDVRIEVSAVGTRPNITTIANIEVDGTLLKHSSVPANFESLRARLRAQKDRIDIVSLEGRIGGGTIRAKDGVILAEQFVPTRYNLQTHVKDAQMQWVEALPPAIGDADLLFDGPVDQLMLSGEVRVKTMNFYDRIDWEDWVVEYGEEFLVEAAPVYQDPYFSMNVAIDSMPGAIKVRNNVGTGTAEAHLKIVGDTSRPGLLGNVEVHPGTEAYVTDRRFEVVRGNIRYQDAYSWDPMVDFDIQTDIASRGQNYRVHYIAEGPFSNWSTRTRSEPDLAQADINALLYFGATMDDLAETGQLGSAVGMAIGDMVVTDFMLTSGAADILPVDVFEFDRVDVVTGVNARGEYSAEPRVLVAKHVDDLLDINVDMDVSVEVNAMRPQDAYLRADKRLSDTFTLSTWYATLQRDRVLPIGGAIGIDGTARWEWESR